MGKHDPAVHTPSDPVIPRRHRAFGLICLVAVLAGVATSGCTKKKKAPADASAPRAASAQIVDAGGPRTLRGKPKSSAELPTTSAAIWLSNLDGQIEELGRLLKATPDHVPHLVSLSAARYTRARYRGDVEEIQASIDIASTCVKVSPDYAPCYLSRAEQEQSLHRFKEARADLERARALGGDRARIGALEADLDWNDGRYDRAIEAIRQARRARPSVSTWIREAQLEHDLGNEREAEVAFETAEDLVTDTNPFPVAHLNFQRGIHRMSLGQMEDACVFLREAIARMPDYVAANEHLAEALHELGRNDQAIPIYERVVQLSNDPEFPHALAALYRETGKAKEATELDAKSRRGYDELLKKYPEAMTWHAAEFFLDVGDKKRALDLLEKNVRLRPNSGSYVALANAQLENARVQDARKSIDRALAMPLVSADLFSTAARIYEKLGDAASAGAFRERAKRIDPR